MKNLIFCFILFLIPSMLLHAQESGTILLKVKNIKKEKGQLVVTVFDDESKWLKSNGACVRKVVEVEGEEAIVKIDDMPFGTYAIACYHDRNSNEKMDKNFIGLPKEPFAMSKKPKSKLRKPRFEEMAFSFNNPEKELVAKLRKF